MKISPRVLCGLSLFLVVGCGGDSSLAPVEGVVTLDGKPVAGASVTFTPVEGGRPAVGETGPDGTFQLTTFESGDGATIGPHQVAVVAVETQAGSGGQSADEDMASLSGYGPKTRPETKKWLVPKSYADPRTSGLEYKVEAGSTNEADFALSSKP